MWPRKIRQGNKRMAEVPHRNRAYQEILHVSQIYILFKCKCPLSPIYCVSIMSLRLSVCVPHEYVSVSIMTKS